MMNKSLFLSFLFILGLGAMQDAYALDIDKSRCNIFHKPNSGNENVDSLIKKYTPNSVQLCKQGTSLKYFMYSVPYITSETVCYVKNIDFGIVENGAVKSSIKWHSKDMGYKLFSMSENGRCRRDYGEYVHVEGVSYDDFKKISDFLKNHQIKKRYFVLDKEKKDFDFIVDDFNFFNKLFIEKNLILTNIRSESKGGEFDLRFINFEKNNMNFVFWINIKIKYNGEILVRRFSKLDEIG